MPTAKEHSPGLVRFLVIAAICLALLIGWDFSSRLFETINLVQSDQQAAASLKAAQDVNAQLKVLKSRVTTDDYAEQYARNKLHWTRPDETLFVSIATPVPSGAAPAAPTAPAPLARPAWRDWLDLLINALLGPTS